MSAALERAREGFQSGFNAAPRVVARAPGRVNLIGEHVDYNDGFVLPFAIDRDVVVCAGPARGELLTVLAVDTPEDSTAEAYVSAVIEELELVGVKVGALDMCVAGDVPIGAGLSSSAALCSATATAVLGLAARSLPLPDVARLCQRAEHRAVNVQCGIMDPFTSLHARAGHALLLDCRTLDFEQVRIPDDAAFLITHSGASRALASSAYNERVAECADAARVLGVRALRDASESSLQLRADQLSPTLYRRARHVISEIERTRAAAHALAAGETRRVGALMQASHESLRRDYEVSSNELDALVNAALQMPGVRGSRLTGAGFGGCTITMLTSDATAEFENRVPELYRQATGLSCLIMRCNSSGGAELIGSRE